MPTARQTRPAPLGCAGHEEDLGDETMLNAYAREEPLSDPRVVIAGISGSRMEDMARPQQSPPSAQLVRSVG
jgi:hypothetical protein